MSRPASSRAAAGRDLYSSAVLGQAGASVALRVSSAAVLSTARSSLYSYQEQPAPGPGGWQAEITCDPAVTDPGGACGPGLDIGPQLTACPRRASGTGLAYWVPELRTLITTAPGTRSASVRCADEDAARHWAVRLTRQMMTSQLLEAGLIYAHAAAFAVQGRGVLAAGHRGQGKTSTLLASLRHLDADYAAGDRILLHAGGQQVRGYPMPYPVRAGLGTLRALPHLAGLIPADWRSIPPGEQRAFPGKVVIDPDGFARMLTRTGAVTSRITAEVMVWPRLDPACKGARAERVPAAEVLRTLTCTRMFMADPERGTTAHTNHWLAPAPPGPAADGHLARTAAALAGLPCYRIHADGDPRALAGSVASVLAELP